MPYASDTDPRAVAARARARARWKAKNHNKERAHQKNWQRKARAAVQLARPFVGVDGEGAGANERGQQIYQLLRAGEDTIFDPKGLSSARCLAFLSDLPPGPIYVGYFFDYDATQILRDLPLERLERLFRREGRVAHSVEWNGFEIDYLPRKYLRVRRVDGDHWTAVNDVGSFFQCRFVKSLEDWDIGTVKERELIQAGKERRGGRYLSPDDLKYNWRECVLLAELMEAFRAVCDEAGYVPRQWQGPGYLASAMMAAHEVPRMWTRKGNETQLAIDVPLEVLKLANDAYYGGRFEVTRLGDIKGPIYSYDINSAYPTAMLSLPCLLHGKWRRGVKDGLYLARASFTKMSKHLGDLPVRSEHGTISWPLKGSGVYWSTEIEAARRAGTKVRILESWGYSTQCECQPFDWVKPIYEERRRIGKTGRGYVLKLGLNSIYGKCAQSVGRATYANPVWASMITAHCRAAIIDASRQAPESVVMIATDGIFTTKPLTLDEGPGLGEWDAKELPGLFVVQPGLYFGSKAPKTRGIGRGFVAAVEPELRATWARWNGHGEFPRVPVPVTAFVGLKMAVSHRKTEKAGKWVRLDRFVSFDPTKKRMWRGKSRMTEPLPGGLPSVPYRKKIGDVWERDEALDDLLLEAMPDWTAATEKAR